MNIRLPEFELFCRPVGILFCAGNLCFICQTLLTPCVGLLMTGAMRYTVDTVFSRAHLGLAQLDQRCTAATDCKYMSITVSSIEMHKVACHKRNTSPSCTASGFQETAITRYAWALAYLSPCAVVAL